MDRTVAIRHRDQAEVQTRELICELLRLFYAKDWVSGTGGGLCAAVGDRGLLVAPTGVHKERVRPDDLFLVDPASSTVLAAPSDPRLSPSQCGTVFCAIIATRGAGSVMHSHALSAVLAADLAEGDGLGIERFEMLKGIRGTSNLDRHLVPIVANTSREEELAGGVAEILADARFSPTYCVLVRDHGAYIWGRDAWEAKRHAEVYHFLFEGMVRRRS